MWKSLNPKQVLGVSTKKKDICKKIFGEIPFKTWKAPLLNEQWRKPFVPFERMFTPPHPPNMSHVTCHVSHVTCHMSRVPCYVSHVFFFCWQSGEAYWWRVCYQRGLTPSSFWHKQGLSQNFFTQKVCKLQHSIKCIYNKYEQNKTATHV